MLDPDHTEAAAVKIYDDCAELEECILMLLDSLEVTTHLAATTGNWHDFTPHQRVRMIQMRLGASQAIASLQYPST